MSTSVEVDSVTPPTVSEPDQTRLSSAYPNYLVSLSRSVSSTFGHTSLKRRAVLFPIRIAHGVQNKLLNLHHLRLRRRSHFRRFVPNG
ncbi:MAG: hypothetical protein ACFCD0_16065 [Gemmataceae bacterium]